ncbi:MAG: helix-turn-helix domain-containing protein [Bacteroidetes bacterium]|nr:helix-turn-helix domain-containing protein [Bacteroidota bacterium]
MNNKENFKALVSTEKTNTVEKNRARIKNRAYLRESQAIALKVLDKLDEPGWSQVRLARAMGVSPQQITKIVKGTENLTLETQIKLQDILNIPILASFYEREFEKLEDEIKFMESEPYTIPEFKYDNQNTSIIRMNKKIANYQDNEHEEDPYLMQA